jgi:CheY-like chemotaxis protein
MLERLGFDVVGARDGDEAVVLFARSRGEGPPFDAVILDLTVPGGMGGQEAMRRLRELDPRVRAIVSSGYSNDPVMASFRDHGFAGVIAKPCRMEELGEALREVLAA